MARRALKACEEAWTHRTFKREGAVILLAVWLLLTLASAFRFLVAYPDAAVLAAMGAAWGPVYATATTMIFLFAGAAFGMDAYAKQLKPGAS